MDLIAQAALTHIETVLTAYLPAVSAASINRDLLILPKQIKPLGIGGYVGMHDDPQAEIFGRFVEAKAEIRVSANNQDLDVINNELSGVMNSLLTTDRETLRGDGIYQLNLEVLSPPDSDNRNVRVATFNVRYEYHEIPTEAGAVISEIALKDLLNPANGKARFLVNLHAGNLSDLPDPLVDFLPLTDTDINQTSPSANWGYNTDELRIEQTNAVRGGGLTATAPRKAGAQLLIRPEGVITPIQHLVLSIDLGTDSSDGIGCVLRWRDSENYYYFLISQRHNYQLFGKKVGGAWLFLDSGGLSEHTDIDLTGQQNLKVVALNNRFSAYLDDNLICEGEDNSIGNAGEAGLLTHGNNAAYFYTVDLIELID